MDPHSEIVVEAQDVSKKYCRQLHRSLRYGIADLVRESIGLAPSTKQRPGEFYAINNMSFQIPRGQGVALMGPNGAGKSTLIKMLIGLIKPTTGTIRMRGSVAALTTLGAGFNPILSGRENAYINGAVLGYNGQEIDERIESMLEFSELGDAFDDPVKSYSAGMRARLGYSIGALLKPDVLILDEVLATGDKGFKLKCFRHLQSLVDDGVSIVVVSHNVGRLTQICDRAIVLDKGDLCFDGDSKQGVAEYYRLLNIDREALRREKRKAKKKSSQSNSEPATPQPRDISASKAWIENLEVLDRRGRPLTDEITKSRGVRLRIRVGCLEPRDDLRLSVSLYSGEQKIAVMNTRPGSLVIDEQLAKTVVLRLPSPPKLSGTFQFEARLTGPRFDEEIDTVQQEFVLNRKSKTGQLVLKHRWEGTELPAEESPQ